MRIGFGLRNIIDNFVSGLILPFERSIKVGDIIDVGGSRCSSWCGKTASPQVYMTNFSAGTLNFQLRAWIDRYENLAQLRSDLSLELKDALAREKIAIA